MKRFFLWFFGLLALGSAILMLSLPTLLSSHWAKENFLQEFNQRINGKLSIDKLQLGWFSAQKISGLELADHNGNRVLSVDQMWIPSSLVRLVFGRPSDFEVKNLETRVEWLTPTKTNFDQIFYPQDGQIKDTQPLASVILNKVNASFSGRSREATLTGNVSNGIKEGQFQANVSLDPEPIVSVDVRQLPVDILAPFSQKERLIEILGSTVDLTIKQKMALNHISELAVNVQSPNLNGTLEGLINHSKFSLKAPATISLKTTDALNRMLFEDKTGQTRFQFNTKEYIDFVFDNFDFSFKEPHFLQTNAKITLPDLQSINKDVVHLDGVELRLSSQEGLLPISYDLKGKTKLTLIEAQQETQLRFTCKGEIDDQKDQTLTIPYDLEVFPLEGKDSLLKMKGVWSSDVHHRRQISGEGSMHDFPLSYFRMWHAKPILSILLGQTLTSDFSFDIEDIEQQRGVLRYTAKGTNWNSEGSLFFHDQIKIKSPVIWNYRLIPVQFDALQKVLLPPHLQSYLLLKPVDINISINKGNLPLPGLIEGLQSRLEKSNIDLKISTTPIDVANHTTAQKMTFNSLGVDLHSESLLKGIQISLDATEENHATAVALQGTLQNVLKEDRIDLINSAITLEANLHQFSLPLFIRFFLPEDVAEKAEALVGPEVDAVASVQIQESQGPIKLSVKGINGNLDFNGMMRNGVLLLTQPLKAQVKATPEFGKAILRDILPPFSNIISAENPLQITIEPQDFSFPLIPFNLNALKIKKGTMYLGKVNFRTSGVLKVLQTLFKSTETPSTFIWFTPLYFSLNEGQVQLQRMDMRIGEHHPIAIWGTINIPQDNVNLILGLTAPALQYTFELTDLPKDYVLQIPVTGTLDDTSIDLKRAIGKISALVAKTQNSTQSKIVGTFLDIVSGRLSENQVPPPTTSPFPWE